jgi:hypothetical protein
MSLCISECDSQNSSSSETKLQDQKGGHFLELDDSILSKNAACIHATVDHVEEQGGLGRVPAAPCIASRI